MKTQIVTTTYNGMHNLKNLLEDIKGFGISNEDVCIVDNESNNIEHLDYIKELNFNHKRFFFSILITRTNEFVTAAV